MEQSQVINDKKNVIWNIIGASANAFNSLFFAIIVTRINGIDNAGIFTFCFATACMLYCVGNYCGRTFQVTDISKKTSDSDYIYHRLITCIIMMVVTLVFSLIKGYDLYKSSILIILCGFKCIEAFSESIYAVIQRNGELYKVGISLFLKAIIALVTLIILDLLTHNLVISCLSIVIINIVFLIFYDFRNMRKLNYVKTKFTKEVCFSIFKSGFFTFILSMLLIYIFNIPRYAIDDLSENSIQTIFGIIIMPASFMWLMGQYIIQPLLTKVANFIENKKYGDLKNLIINLVFIIIVLGIIITAIAWLLEAPVLGFVYGVNLTPYFNSMMVIIIGSIFYSLITILSALLVAMRKTLSQTVIYSIIAFFSTTISYVLVKLNAVVGASITYFISMLMVAVSFIILIIYNMKKYKIEWKG